MVDGKNVNGEKACGNEMSLKETDEDGLIKMNHVR